MPLLEVTKQQTGCKAMGQVVEDHRRWSPDVPYATNKHKVFDGLLKTMKKSSLDDKRCNELVKPAIHKLHDTTAKNCSIVDIACEYWTAYKSSLEVCITDGVFHQDRRSEILDDFEKAIKEDMKALEHQLKSLRDDLKAGHEKDALARVELCAILSRPSEIKVPSELSGLFDDAEQLKQLFNEVEKDQNRSKASNVIKLRMLNLGNIVAKKPSSPSTLPVGRDDTLGYLNFPKAYHGPVMRFYKRITLPSADPEECNLRWERLEDTSKVRELDKGKKDDYEIYFALTLDFEEKPDFVIAIVHASKRKIFPHVLRYNRAEMLKNQMTIIQYLTQEKIIDKEGQGNMLIKKNERIKLSGALQFSDLSSEDCSLVLDFRIPGLLGKILWFL